jgi:hypothetical protein
MSASCLQAPSQGVTAWSDKNSTLLRLRGLHDVMKRGSVGAEMLREGAVDQLQSISVLAGASSPYPPRDLRPVDVGQAQLTRAVDSRHPSADPTGERFTGRHGVEGRPGEEGPSLAVRLVAKPGEDSRPIPSRLRSRRTNRSHSMTRGSPAASDQQKPEATRVPSVVSTSQAWSSNCDGRFRAKAMYDATGSGMWNVPRSAATGISTACSAVSSVSVRGLVTTRVPAAAGAVGRAAA